MKQLLAEIQAKIAALEEEYGFGESDDLDDYNTDSWDQPKQRGWGQYEILLWIRDRLTSN